MIDNLGVNTEMQWMCCQIYTVDMRYNRLMNLIEC